MPITGWPSDSATHPRQLLECERSTPTGRPSGDRGWFARSFSSGHLMENPPKGRRSRGPAASGGSLSFRHPFQGRKPQIMAAMHEAFVRLAKVRSVVTLADLIGDDKAGVALRLEIPGMVEARRRSGP